MFNLLMQNTGGVNPNLINLVVSKLAHFIIMTTSVLLTQIQYRMNHIYYREPSDEAKNSALNQGLIIGKIFNFISNLGTIVKVINSDMAIHLEMAVLYFLEYFTDTIMQELEEDEVDSNILTSRHLLFQATVQNQNMFNTVDTYCTLCINKCLSNLSYKNFKLSKYSIEIMY
jgi:hypothetical protein